MTDQNRLLQLIDKASDLGIRLHCVSTDLKKQKELEPTEVKKMFGVDVISDTFQQDGYLDFVTAYKRQEGNDG